MSHIPFSCAKSLSELYFLRVLETIFYDITRVGAQEERRMKFPMVGS